MKKEIKVILPTIEQANNYFKRNGYPDGWKVLVLIFMIADMEN